MNLTAIFKASILTLSLAGSTVSYATSQVLALCESPEILTESGHFKVVLSKDSEMGLSISFDQLEGRSKVSVERLSVREFAGENEEFKVSLKRLEETSEVTFQAEDLSGKGRISSEPIKLFCR